jgi:penicillin-binding protein 1B
LTWVEPGSGLLTRKGCGKSKQYPYISGSEPTAYSSCGQKVFEQDKSWFNDFFETDPNQSEPSESEPNPSETQPE